MSDSSHRTFLALHKTFCIREAVYYSQNHSLNLRLSDVLAQCWSAIMQVSIYCDGLGLAFVAFGHKDNIYSWCAFWWTSVEFFAKKKTLVLGYLNQTIWAWTTCRMRCIPRLRDSHESIVTECGKGSLLSTFCIRSGSIPWIIKAYSVITRWILKWSSFFSFQAELICSIENLQIWRNKLSVSRYRPMFSC